jgi:hypothetical protein
MKSVYLKVHFKFLNTPDLPELIRLFPGRFNTIWIPLSTSSEQYSFIDIDFFFFEMFLKHFNPEDSEVLGENDTTWPGSPEFIASGRERNFEIITPPL